MIHRFWSSGGIYLKHGLQPNAGPRCPSLSPYVAASHGHTVIIRVGSAKRVAQRKVPNTTCGFKPSSPSSRATVTGNGGRILFPSAFGLGCDVGNHDRSRPHRPLSLSSPCVTYPGSQIIGIYLHDETRVSDHAIANEETQQCRALDHEPRIAHGLANTGNGADDRS